MKNPILFLLHIPPPTHGSSVVGMTIKESAIINNNFNCKYINLLASKNVADAGIVNADKIWFFLGSLVKVFGAIIQNRPILCYVALTTTGAAFFRDVFFVTLLNFFKIDHIYHLHNKGVSLHKNKNIYRLCYKYVFRNAEVILLSKRLYPDIEAFVPESKIHICPNGIANEGLNSNQKISRHKPPQHSVKPQVSKKTIQILFLSNLLEAKGVYILLEACKILKNRNINFHCNFVGGEGDINEQQFLNKTKDLNLSGFVDYRGKKYGLEKEDTYNHADIFALPTFYSNECFPLVLIEAMQHSLPIVTTFEGGIPDIVEDEVTGFLVAQRNVEILAQKLELLIQNSTLRHQMGAAGRKKYEKEYSLEIFENRLKEILEKVIKSKLNHMVGYKVHQLNNSVQQQSIIQYD